VGGEDFSETTIAGERSGERVLLLVMVSGGVMEFDLATQGEFTVGRSPNADIHIDAPSVSRVHALLKAQGDRVTLQDMRSTNGTNVNGAHIGEEPVSIHVGDAIRFGDVMAQVRGARASRVFTPRMVRGVEFDARLGEEAERCMRYNRSLTAIAVETLQRDDNMANRAKQVVVANLRALDAGTVRAPGRIDILAVECEKDEAKTIAHRIHDSLVARGVEARVGVAAYPGDVPSPESLLLAAQLAMHSAKEGKVGVAREGVRMLKLAGREIIVAEPAVVRLFGLIERVAASSVPVLVHGETGSGKEIVAEAIHGMSGRVNRRLVKLNCAALPENLLESELFGYEKGAFTGAVGAKAGLFEEAQGGTLFLDEVGEMTAALQAKLLRVLEDHKVRRVGATREMSIDVRVVAATHRDLKARAAEGSFRHDLFYRLSAMVLHVPPLRDRPREIPLLAERFAAEACAEAGRQHVPVSSEVMAILRGYHWPGNIRELRNAMNTAVMMCDGPAITAAHLPGELRGDPLDPEEQRSWGPAETVRFSVGRSLPLENELKDLEREQIREALERCDGNQTKAADALGMPRRTLVYKIATLGVDAPKRRRGRRPGPSGAGAEADDANEADGADGADGADRADRD
jgi:DNA-binding NtrC family response regulator